MGQEDDCRAERGFQHSLKVMELIFRQFLLMGNLCVSILNLIGISDTLNVMFILICGMLSILPFTKSIGLSDMARFERLTSLLLQLSL